MTIEELMAKLSVYPPHFTVQAVVVQSDDDDDLTSDFVNVRHDPAGKLVDVVLDGRPM